MERTVRKEERKKAVTNKGKEGKGEMFMVRRVESRADPGRWVGPSGLAILGK